MSEIVVRHFDPSLLDELVRIAKKTMERFPDFPPWAHWVYRHNPELKAQNMFTASIGSQVTGYGHLIPRPAYDGDPPEVPHTVYLDLNADPDAESPERVLDALYAALCRLAIREWLITTRAEKERYLELNKLAFPEEALTIEHRDGHRKIPHWRTFVIDNALGQAIGLITVRSEKKQHGYIENLLVLPEHRRRGYAEALMHAGLTYLREQGFRSALLHVADSNTPAFRLYRKASFVSLKEQVELRLVWGME